jgi:polyketide biosynthesis acyl carrier protein
MEKETIFAAIKKNALAVLIDVPESQITLEKSLKDLGANSVDRVEIAQYSMEELGLVVPRLELGQVTNINDLVEVFYRYKK